MNAMIDALVERAAREVTPNSGTTLYPHNLALNRRTIEIAVRAACACKSRQLKAARRRLQAENRKLHEDLAEQAQLIDALHE
jgi:hypothetical protein